MKLNLLRKKLLMILLSAFILLVLMACGKKKEEIDSSTKSPDANIGTNTSDLPLLSLGEILGETTPTPILTAELNPTMEPTSTMEPTPTVTLVSTPTTTVELPTTETSEQEAVVDNVELADTLFDLLSKQEETQTKSDNTAHVDEIATNAMTIFANNIKSGNYQELKTASLKLEDNMSNCTILSNTPKGSITSFISNNSELVNSILVVYVTDLTAWTVIGENNVIYALMPTPESKSTEYEKQIMQAIMDSYSNGKDLHIEFLYPYSSVFDATNNCACYMITTDGTFNIGSNAKTFAFYKYDFKE